MMKYKLRMFLYALVVPCVAGLVSCDKKNDRFKSIPYCGQGDQAMEDGDSDAAIEYYGKAIDCDASCAEAYHKRASLYFNAEEYDKAISDCAEVIKLAPKIADVYFTRANSYLLTEQYEKAIADCNNYIGFDPEVARGYYMRGQAYQYLGENERAFADYTHIIEMKLADEADNAYLALTYFDRAFLYEQKGDLKAANIDRAKATELAPFLTE